MEQLKDYLDQLDERLEALDAAGTFDKMHYAREAVQAARDLASATIEDLDAMRRDLEQARLHCLNTGMEP